MKFLKFLVNVLCILGAIVCAAVIVCALWIYAMDEPLYSWSSAAHMPTSHHDTTKERS